MKICACLWHTSGDEVEDVTLEDLFEGVEPRKEK